MKPVQCPQQCNTSAAADFNLLLLDVWNEPEVGIEFRTISFVFPFGTLLIAESLRQFVESRKARGLVTYALAGDRVAEAQNNALSYLKHVGFFQHVGLDIGKAPGEAQGPHRYISITPLTFGNLETKNSTEQVQYAIQRKSRELAEVLVDDDESARMLGYCFQEILRNVYEHAQTDTCVLMAQKYRNRKRAELAIFDRGIGIQRSLQATYPTASPSEAIEFAMLPGISSALDLHSEADWANSGFGLFVLSSMGKRLGRFDICSSGFLKSESVDNAAVSEIHYEGTGVGVEISIEDAEYFPNLLQTIVAQGEEDAFRRTGVRHTASRSTLGLWW